VDLIQKIRPLAASYHGVMLLVDFVQKLEDVIIQKDDFEGYVRLWATGSLQGKEGPAMKSKSDIQAALNEAFAQCDANNDGFAKVEDLKAQFGDICATCPEARVLMDSIDAKKTTSERALAKEQYEALVADWMQHRPADELTALSSRQPAPSAVVRRPPPEPKPAPKPDSKTSSPRSPMNESHSSPRNSGMAEGSPRSRAGSKESVGGRSPKNSDKASPRGTGPKRDTGASTAKSKQELKQELMAAFDELDKEKGGFVPRLDLRKKVDSFVATCPAAKELSLSVRALTSGVVERKEFQTVVTQWAM